MSDAVTKAHQSAERAKFHADRAVNYAKWAWRFAIVAVIGNVALFIAYVFAAVSR